MSSLFLLFWLISVRSVSGVQPPESFLGMNGKAFHAFIKASRRLPK